MYASIIKIDYTLLVITSTAAILGGYVGNRIVYFKLDSNQIKKIIAILLYLIAIKLAYTLI